MKSLARSRSLTAILLLSLAALVAGCGPDGPAVPPDVTYHRVPTAVERIVLEPEVITVDNCDAASSSQRWAERTLTLGETVYLNQEEAEAVALALGISYYVQAQVQLQNEISTQFGAGLSSGETKTQGFQVNVGPHQTAVTTLQWTETWEEGYFEILRDDQYIGRVHYRLLADLQLDASTETYDCTPIGRVKQAFASKLAQAGIFVRSVWTSVASKWQAARDTWPWGHLEWWVGGGALLVVVLVAAFLRRRWRASADEYDDFYV